MRIEAIEGGYLEIRVDYVAGMKPKVKIIAHTETEITFVLGLRALRVIEDEIGRAIKVLEKDEKKIRENAREHVLEAIIRLNAVAEGLRKGEAVPDIVEKHADFYEAHKCFAYYFNELVKRHNEALDKKRSEDDKRAGSALPRAGKDRRAMPQAGQDDLQDMRGCVACGVVCLDSALNESRCRNEKFFRLCRSRGGHVFGFHAHRRSDRGSREILV